MCVNGTYYKSAGTSAHRFMGGNDKQKLTRFIINNFMLNLDSPLVPPLCRAPNLLEVNLPQFGNIGNTYNVLLSVERGKN